MLLENWSDKMFKKKKYLTFLSCLIILFLALSAPPAFANDIQTDRLEVFFENTMNAQLEKYHIPNATVSLVKDGEIVYKKGFGLADIEKNIPVDADTTLFRIGSTSKLITWTAVMQLVEAGQLDLHTDINKYLDFEISPQLEKPLQNVAAQPITMIDLMTHTPGFEDHPEMLFRLSEDQLLPLDEYIKNHQPARIFPPGEVAAYSNYGTALAGYIVERISGLAFPDYVKENIFTPLNMKNSTFRQPPNLEAPARMAKPYRFINGSFTEANFEYILLEPAGSMSCSAADMANFMIAHLSGGTFKGGRILKEETLDEMHKRQFSYDPTLGGMTLGFIEGVFNEQEVLFHGGSTMLYNTGLYLLPGVDTGIFISYSGGNHLLHAEVFQEFMDYYYPIEADAKGVPAEGSRERAMQYVGEYQMNRRSVTTNEKIDGILAGGIIKADVNEDGYLLITHGGEINEFIELEPGVYQNLRAGRTQDAFGPFHKIIFKTDPLGKMMLTTDGPMTYSKAPVYSTMSFTALAALIILLTITSSLLYWVIIMMVGWLKKAKNKRPRFSSFAYWLGIGTSITILAFFATLFSAGIDPVYQLPAEAYTPVEPGVFIALIPTFILICGCFLAPATGITWWKGFGGWMARVHYSIFTLAVMGLIWMLHYWNLLTW